MLKRACKTEDSRLSFLFGEGVVVFLELLTQLIGVNKSTPVVIIAFTVATHFERTKIEWIKY